MAWTNPNLITAGKLNIFLKDFQVIWTRLLSSTCVCQEFGGFQDLFCVDARFIIVHFRSNHMNNSGSTASNSPSSAIQPINILLLQSDDTLIHILQNVILCKKKIEIYI